MSKNRKRKKTKRKNKNNKQQVAQDQSPIEPSNDEAGAGDIHPAIDYLRKWKHDRSSWSFKKIRQVWLLKNMMDADKVDQNDFKILLKYMQGLRGSARDTTLKLAKEKMDQADSTDSSKVQEIIESPQYKRLLEVLRILS